MYTEEQLKNSKTRFRINNKLYQVAKSQSIKKGDMLLDKKDGMYGIADTVTENMVGMRDGFVIEGVPINRVLKLEIVTN